MIHKKEARIFKRYMQEFTARVAQLNAEDKDIAYKVVRVVKRLINFLDEDSLLARKYGPSANQYIWCWENGVLTPVPFTEWRFQYAIRRVATVINVSPRTLEACVDAVLDQGTFWNEEYDCWDFNMPPTFMAIDAVKGYRWVPLTTEIA